MFFKIKNLRKNLFVIATFAVLGFGITSCSQAEENVVQPQVEITEEVINQQLAANGFFIVRDMGGNVVRKFSHADFVKSVKSNLIHLKRLQDAANFSKTYNSETGVMFSSAEKFLKSNHATLKWNDKISLYYSSHLQNIGWAAEVSAGEMSGTTGQSRRLECFKLRDANPSIESPKILYSGRPMNGTWQTGRRMQYNEPCGTVYQNTALEFIKIYSDPFDLVAQGYHAHYRLHISNGIGNGNSAYNAYEGETLGEQGKQIEAIWVEILGY
jgi:hypothetical protein